MAKFSQICADLVQMGVYHAKRLTLSTLGLLACEGPGITVERIDIRSERLSTETADGAIAVSLETELDSEFTNISSIPVGVVFSAPVAGFDASDLDVTGGSVHDFAGEGELYSFSLVLEDDGEVVLRLPANAVQSEDGRSNSAAEPLVFVFDSTPPSVSLTTSLAELTNVSPIPVTITFSEEVSGFDAGGISVTNGTTSDFAGSGSSYTLNVTPSAQGIVSVDVAAGVASDPSSNTNTAASQYSLTYDSDPPSSPGVTINFDAGYTNTTSVTLNLSAVGAAAMYITNTAGCSAGGDWQTYATSRTWTLEQTNAETTFYAKFKDLVGNETSCVSDTIVHDDVSPQTPVIADASKPFNASFLTSIQQNPVSDPSFKEFRYTLDGTNPTCSTGMFSTSEPASVTIPAATTTLKVIACDEVGLFSPVAAAEYVFDNIKPSVTITTEVSSLTNESPITVTITFSENVSGFEEGDISVTNGATSDFSGSGSSYTVNVTPSAQGAVWIDVAAGVASDPSSNANVASESLGISYDAVAPEFTSLNILTPSPSTELNPTVEIEVDTAPVLVELYSDSGCSSSISDWKWIVFGTTIQISTSSLNENVVTDIYTKGRDDHYNYTDCELVGSYAHDNVSPQTPVIADASKSFNASFLTSIQQNPVSDPSFKEFRYTLDGTNPTCSTGMFSTSEPASVTIPAATTTLNVIACDEVGLFSPVAAAEYVFDNIKPSVTVTTEVSSPTNVSPIPVTITFSEEVSGFDADDISVTNGTTSDFSGSGSSYTVNVTPSAQGGVSVHVPAGVTVDQALNGNAAATQLSLTYDTQAPVLTDLSIQTSSPSTNLTPTVAFTLDEPATMTLYNSATCSSAISVATAKATGAQTMITTTLADAAVTDIYIKGSDAAYNDSGCELVGSYTTQLAAPSLSSPIIYPTSLGVMWGSVTGATSYNLYWSTSAGVTMSSDELAGVTSMYTHTSLTSGTTYYYRVAAVKNGIVGALSSEVSGLFLATPGAPTSVSGTEGYTQVSLTWNAPSYTGSDAISDYLIEYSTNSGYSWTTFPDGTSAAESATVTGLDNDITYIFRVAAINSEGPGSFSDNSASLTPFIPDCAASCYDEGSMPNAQDLDEWTERNGPDGSIIHFKYANGHSGFKIWKDKHSSRILNATGLIANGWQKKLTRAGTGFTETDFTDDAGIAGRACPTNVFLHYGLMTDTGRCLYYDGGNAAQTLDAAGTSGVEAEDWLQGWGGVATGRGASSSYYEGNIKTCADKGMRLPTLYETDVGQPALVYLPDGDGITPTYSPGYGVPAATTWTWTASGSKYNGISYWAPISVGLASKSYTDSTLVSRCVLPNSMPQEYVTVSTDVTVQDTRTGLWWSNDRGSMNWPSGIDHCAGLSYNGRDNWRMPTRSELETWYNNNLLLDYFVTVWSSSTFSGYYGFAWYVSLYNGVAQYYDKTGSRSVLCVSP